MGSNKISTIDLEEPVVETLNTIDTVADQVTVVSGNTNTILTTVQDNNAKISAINANVDSVNVNVDNSKTMIENMEARINEMENNINAGFQQNKLDSNSISAALSGASSPYGTGILGDVVYDPSTFLWGTPDHLGRYMLYAESFTVPEGVTMTPPARCNGVYIFSKGDVTINGTIDLRSKRILSANVSIPDTITVDGVEYALAKGGDSQKGGNGGASGSISGKLTSGEESATRKVTSASGGSAKTPVSGSVCGGGYGSYGTGATGKSASVYFTQTYKYVYHQGDYYFSWDPYDSDGNTGSDAASTAGSVVDNTTCPCALVIIAAGNVIINGSVVSSGGGGIAATSGTATYPSSTGSAPSSVTGTTEGATSYNTAKTATQSATTVIYAGNGGNGTCPPTGGGPVTIICNTFTNNGSINTNGDKISAVGVSDGTLTTSYSKKYSTTLVDPQDSDAGYTISITAKISSGTGTAATAGGDLTCISTAGEIKVYERGAA